MFGKNHYCEELTDFNVPLSARTFVYTQNTKHGIYKNL